MVSAITVYDPGDSNILDLVRKEEVE